MRRPSSRPSPCQLRKTSASAARAMDGGLAGETVMAAPDGAPAGRCALLDLLLLEGGADLGQPEDRVAVLELAGLLERFHALDALPHVARAQHAALDLEAAVDGHRAGSGRERNR